MKKQAKPNVWVEFGSTVGYPKVDIKPLLQIFNINIMYKIYFYVRDTAKTIPEICKKILKEIDF